MVTVDGETDMSPIVKNEGGKRQGGEDCAVGEEQRGEGWDFK